MVGIDYDLFWELDPMSIKPIVKAFDLKREEEDSIAWQHGMYIRLAIASVMDSNVKYPKSPLSQMNNIKPKSAEDVQEDIKAKMLERMKVINCRFKEG